MWKTAKSPWNIRVFGDEKIVENKGITYRLFPYLTFPPIVNCGFHILVEKGKSYLCIDI